MENIKNFSIKRLLWMMRKDLFDNLKFVLIGYGSMVGLFSFIFFFIANNSYGEKIDLTQFYLIGLFLTGIFISGMAFTDFRSKERAMSYLTIPASLLEKFLSILFLTTIGFIVSFTVIFFVFNGIAIIAGLAFFDLEVNFINLFTLEVWKTLSAYIVIQSLFLAGAATFRKVPLFFTILIMFIGGIIMSTYLGILSYSLFNEFNEASNSDFGIFSLKTKDFRYNAEDETALKYFKYFINYATAPIFWVVTYLKLKEKEV